MNNAANKATTMNLIDIDDAIELLSFEILKVENYTVKTVKLIDIDDAIAQMDAIMNAGE